MHQKLEKLFFENVATKMKKVIKTAFFVVLYIFLVAWAIAFVVLFFQSLSELRWTAWPFFAVVLGMPIAGVAYIFVHWLANTTLYMFCELVENSSKITAAPANAETEEQIDDALKF